MSASVHGCLKFRQASAPNSIAPRALSLVGHVAGTLRLWRRRMRDRAALRRLTYRDMRDMGITPADISWEVSQPFWREAPRR